MRKVLGIIMVMAALASSASAQFVRDTTLLLPKADMQWWRDAKFGLFIHFGLYALEGRGEWVMWDEQIDTADYSRLRERFTCERLDAAQWVKAAQDAGCRYMVVTARHHDGFSLFDTKFGTYDARHSAAHRDIIGEYVAAAHKAGMRTGIYYSPLDWRYPGFFFPGVYRSNAEEMKRQTYTQVRELMTNYGQVDILWYDGGEDNWLGFGGLEWKGGWVTRGYEKPYTGKFSWEPLKLNRMVRELQPRAVISSRSGWMGDFDTQEVRFKGRPAGEVDRPYEMCTRLGGDSWGWSPSSATDIMSLDSCIQLLVRVVTQDGNLMLNVGPRPDGQIEPAEVQRLKEIGGFLSRYGESIYETRGGTYDESWGGTTVTPKAVYIHVVKVPGQGEIRIPTPPGKVVSVKRMRDGGKVAWKQNGSEIVLQGVTTLAGEPDLVIKLALQ